MYRRASVEIRTAQTPKRLAELGRTLLKTIDSWTGKDLLLQSVRVAPTRQRMESLLEAAAKSVWILYSSISARNSSVGTRSEAEYAGWTVMAPQEFARTASDDAARSFSDRSASHGQ